MFGPDNRPFLPANSRICKDLEDALFFPECRIKSCSGKISHQRKACCRIFTCSCIFHPTGGYEASRFNLKRWEIWPVQEYGTQICERSLIGKTEPQPGGRSHEHCCFLKHSGLPQKISEWLVSTHANKTWLALLYVSDDKLLKGHSGETEVGIIPGKLIFIQKAETEGKCPSLPQMRWNARNSITSLVKAKDFCELAQLRLSA